jgi:hypothetical protein
MTRSLHALESFFYIVDARQTRDLAKLNLGL